MTSGSGELIRVGQLELRFLVDDAASRGALCMFEMTVPGGAKVPAPHFHRDVDEAVYGLEGVLTYTVDGVQHRIGAGAHLFSPRGAVHHFANTDAAPARVLTVLTPASIGPAYFREIGALVGRGGPPDPTQVKDIMLRHGLVPATV
jgi:quercetin dioxygenase-like cupin family protein